MVKPIVLFKDAQLLTELERVEQGVPSVVSVAHFLVKLVLNDLEPVLLGHDGLVIFLHTVVELPCWLFLLKRFFELLLLEVFALQLSTLLLRQFHLLDLGRFLGAHSLKLHGRSFVFKRWHCVSQVQLDAMLLEDVVEC